MRTVLLATAMATGALLSSAMQMSPATAAAAAPPEVQTGLSQEVSAATATVAGTVIPNGLETAYYFEYGPDRAYGEASQILSAGAGIGSVPVQAGLSGLAYGSRYHYRLRAYNALGGAVGGDRVFRTRDAVLAGAYSVRAKILKGGRRFGQRRGQTFHRVYRFSARCRKGHCRLVRLRRRGARGVFSSRLRRRAGDLYRGRERARGRCTNGERFRSNSTVTIRPTTVDGSLATVFDGRLKVHMGGCARGFELAELSGIRLP